MVDVKKAIEKLTPKELMIARRRALIKMIKKEKNGQAN